MSKATLVIMAAGIGSRFGGGIKQLEPVGPTGELIVDYSVYDAVEAGFDKAVFVIRKSIEREFKESIGRRIANFVNVDYVFQEINDIPEEYVRKFPDRTKPWGTGQAILSCKNVVDSPFIVINADDYYGKDAFKKGYAYLLERHDKHEICMISFVLKNTLSDNGVVTRGLCEVDDNNMLTKIVETRNIAKIKEGAGVLQADGGICSIDPDSVVSMNMWGLHPDFINVLDRGFGKFLDELPPDDLNSEYLLPTIIGNMLKNKSISVKVLKSNDKWFGVTYKADKESVVTALRDLTDAGVYKRNLYK